MEIVVAAIGRARAAPEHALAEQYLARAGGLGAGLGLGPCRLVEAEDRRPGPVERRRARDAALLRAALPAGQPFVALDDRGAALDSLGFARRLADWRDQGHRALGFVIGGADGLDPALRREAAACLAFGPMTWPHLLVRAMLAEQIYRAVSILADHPYHRG
jgi:23S rRNA (pseudouridine1915-N3)-methyltransferase